MSAIDLPAAEPRVIAEPRSGEKFVSISDLAVWLSQGELASESAQTKQTLSAVREWLAGLR